jgi:SAM-dependent methyltransferase
MALEIRESFTSADDWNAWADAVKPLRSTSYLDEVARSVRSSGFIDPSSGVVPAQEVTATGRNYREGLIARGCTARYRALQTLVLDYVLVNGWCSPIYLAEQATDFGEMMRNRFPFIITSEYMPNPVIRMRMSHIRHEDPLNLTLPDHSFDLYVSSDSMVYVPSLEGVLREARRVLRRGGQFLATFPFRYGEPDTEVLAEQVQGEVVHHVPPTFHVDPLSGSRSRLLYFVPGWDVLDAARSAGFQSAEIVVQSSRIHAIIGSEIATVFVLKATA